MPADSRRVQELFVAALDLADPLARQEFLDRECAADADLRRRLTALLMAHDDAAAALSQPGASPPPGPPVRESAETGPYHDSTPNQGTVIAGRYKLLEQLGEVRRKGGKSYDDNGSILLTGAVGQLGAVGRIVTGLLL